MSKKTFDENLATLGIPDKASLDALVELTPEAKPFYDEIVEVLASIPPGKLLKFIENENPTPLASAILSLRTG